MGSIAAGGVQAKPDGLITREAKRDLSSYQYHAMKIDTDQYIDYVDTSSAGPVNGILQNKPDAALKEAEIATEGTSLMVVDGNSPNISEGTKLGSNSAYHGVAVSADKAIYFAIAMEPSTADGDIIEVKLVGEQNISV
jgi:hypothetical protein